MQKFGVQPVVSINRFSADTDAEIKLVEEKCKALGVEALMAIIGPWAARARPMSRRSVVKIADSGKSKLNSSIRTICRWSRRSAPSAARSHRAKDISIDKPVRDLLASYEAMGYGKFPICMAKTQYSFTTDPDAKGAPSDHIIPVRELRLSAGAEFVVAICGEILTMPGLPRVPSAD